MSLPDPIQRAIDAFAALPGIGPKSASRLTFYLLREQAADLRHLLAEAILGLDEVRYCRQCFNFTTADAELCPICSDPQRDRRLLCVVEEPLDVVAIERTAAYHGLYHVLHGALSPIEGIGPEDLKIRELLTRVRQGGIEEVIIATNPSMEGDATAMYLHRVLAPLGVKITRLARGLPVGGDVEYADQNTLRGALAERREMR